MRSEPFSITAFYAFIPLEERDLSRVRSELLAYGKKHEMRGLVLLALEGINGTVSGSGEAIGLWKTHLYQNFGDIAFNDSASLTPAFKRLAVKIKPEIVALKKPNIRPSGKHKHLSPQEWKAAMHEKDVILLDARNDYEFALGKFRGAVKSGTEVFQEFPEKIREHKIPKSKKVLLYCTGGIRCEKALLAMEEEGYNNVYQLKGGILAYLEQFPSEDFEGECFVFDHRVAVDQRLEPSELYDICPHCGMPGDHAIDCRMCGASQKICVSCAKEFHRKTCSKRCANEVRLGQCETIQS